MDTRKITGLKNTLIRLGLTSNLSLSLSFVVAFMLVTGTPYHSIGSHPIP